MSDVKVIWQNQPVEEKEMITISDIRARADKLRSRIRWRNVALYVWSAFNIVAGLWLMLWGVSPLVAYRYPMLLMIVAHLFVLWQINYRIGTRPLPEELGARSALNHHRQELERQHNALSNAWLWYIAPFMPALIWELAIRALRANPNIPAFNNRMIVFYLISGAILFWTAVWLAFSRAALKLQFEIEQLKRVQAE
jgi:hypothetical protein